MAVPSGFRPGTLGPREGSTWRTTPCCQHLGLERDTVRARGSGLAQEPCRPSIGAAAGDAVAGGRDAARRGSRRASVPQSPRVLHYREVPPFISNPARPTTAEH